MPTGLPHESAGAHPRAWAGLLAIVAAAYLAARLLTWLGLAIAFTGWRRSSGRHWTDRARRAWPGRRLAPWAWFIVPYPLLFSLIGTMDFDALGRSWSVARILPATARDLLLLVATYLGVLQSRFAWERRVNPAAALTPRTRRGTWTLRALTLAFWAWLPYAYLGRFLIARADLELAVAGVGLLTMATYLLGGKLALLRWMGLRRPAPDRLRAIVGATSARMGIRPRSVEVIAMAWATGLAFPLSGRLAATDAAMAVLDDDELAVICAHELAHLGESRWVTIARLLHVISTLVQIALPLVVVALVGRAFDFWTGYILLVVLTVLWLIGTALHQRLYRRMEVRADAMASAVEAGPGTYARALEKLYRTNAVPVVLSKASRLYPDLYDRMIASGLEPDYPRPAPPSGLAALGGLAAMLIGSIAGGFGLVWLARTIG